MSSVTLADACGGLVGLFLRARAPVNDLDFPLLYTHPQYS